MNNQLCLPINIIKNHSLLNQVKAWNTLLKQVLNHYQKDLYINLFIALLEFKTQAKKIWEEEEEVFVLALTTKKGTVKAFPTEPASSPTLPSNAKRALYAICATLVPVTLFSDQPEDALDKIVVTAIWKPKPPQLY